MENQTENEIENELDVGLHGSLFGLGYMKSSFHGNR